MAHLFPKKLCYFLNYIFREGKKMNSKTSCEIRRIGTIEDDVAKILRETELPGVLIIGADGARRCEKLSPKDIIFTGITNWQ